MWVARLCPALYDPMGCCPPGSSVHGILQARMLEWAAIPFSRGSSRPTEGSNLHLLHCRQIHYHLSHQNVARATKIKSNLKLSCQINELCLFYPIEPSIVFKLLILWYINKLLKNEFLYIWQFSASQLNHVTVSCLFCGTYKITVIHIKA